MDDYLMPVANLLVDAAPGHKIISFMDGNAGYNQISWQKRIFPRLHLDVQDI
jgi:hypothetical protein